MDSAGGIFHTGYSYGGQLTPERKLSDAKTGDPFVIEDLLDFPSDDGGGLEAAVAVENTSLSSVNTAEDPPLGGFHSAGGHFSGELSLPYDDVAELEWLSNFVEDSFSSEEDLHKLHLIQGTKARPENQTRANHKHKFQPEPARPEIPIPAKARSKRSRAASGNWASHLLWAESEATGSTDQLGPQKGTGPGPAGGREEGRRCLHCSTDKTPQWRTGPMGPKTLCNACGVRYKSGRLVPEYRPAASPTFVLTKHSNSHRKVLELRRQKEMVRAHQQQQNVMFDVSNGEDYLIHQHVGPDFRQMI
ncbi:GATA transcription factor 9 [Striga hermonthica]|uniref:GATA transcription factor n=1 Tax=Striga hermonthica TaxID=68872 RepID=A0A9N7NUI0_STRHE|nr:GATA transcription factor 9 [Striga hermonthica]